MFLLILTLFTVEAFGKVDDENPQEYPLGKLISEFSSDFIFKEYERCRNLIAKDFKPQLSENFIVEDEAEGNIHSEFDKCLDDVRRIQPGEIGKMIRIQSEHEMSYIHKLFNKFESDFFERVNTGYRINDCPKEISAIYPKYYFYWTKKEMDEIGVINLCNKYKNYIEKQKSP